MREVFVVPALIVLSLMPTNHSCAMNRQPIPLSQENPLWISWHDTAWIPILNPTNVMDYFQEKSNPFYDRTCNNEMVKMQRVGIEQMKWVCVVLAITLRH